MDGMLQIILQLMRNMSTEVRSETIPRYLGKDEGQYTPWPMAHIQSLKFILNIIYI